VSICTHTHTTTHTHTHTPTHTHTHTHTREARTDDIDLNNVRFPTRLPRAAFTGITFRTGTQEAIAILFSLIDGIHNNSISRAKWVTFRMNRREEVLKKLAVLDPATSSMAFFPCGKICEGNDDKEESTHKYTLSGTITEADVCIQVVHLPQQVHVARNRTVKLLESSNGAVSMHTKASRE